MKQVTPLKAIRAFCLQCVCGSSMEVELCTANTKDILASRKEGDDTPYEPCPLYPYRFGKGVARAARDQAKKALKKQKKAGLSGKEMEKKDDSTSKNTA